MAIYTNKVRYNNHGSFMPRDHRSVGLKTDDCVCDQTPQADQDGCEKARARGQSDRSVYPSPQCSFTIFLDHNFEAGAQRRK